MALDFDVDDAPTFPELVRDARLDVMKGRTMTACWVELADQHTVFRDIAKEGRTRGEILGAVLAAVQGICQALQRVELSNPEVRAPSPACTALFSSPAQGAVGDTRPGRWLEEAQTLAQVSRAYVSLYCSTPIPTCAQWVRSLQPVFPQPLNAVSTAANGASASRFDDDAGAVPATPASSTLCRYLTKLRQSVDDVAQELPDSEVDGKDGSFAEEKLKELVVCCMTVGRRVARPTMLPPLDAILVREMVKVLQDFVGNSTLEW
ncbi:conserved hypothetical protein [Leishmania major strain Friedlin]|uniref:Uncharacterized protein n=1 Tax=Leishmania major TaxID=5664 RepID=E9AFG3_LEIMA|nr:conserved hypothetical protein [Leishmania major strain Friedlin]CAG9582694.1 hypothetical_protein_-_conserved [Leishmania major strain Friedlin]CBZ12967.1 conserved hypothetical protein [Leishmania major strain Friedlin]|eukprot:XP_003722733.1 conserved hypothetical protein [Leishmania major strain Friedlin]